MSSAGFQAALAHLLVDDSLRQALESDGPALQQRFALSEPELHALRALDSERLELMVDAVAGKRLQLLRRALPQTLRFLEQDDAGAAFLRDFFTSRPPLVEEHEDFGNNRLLMDSHRLADCLAARRPAGLPPYLADLAELEAIKITLSLGAEASAAAAGALRGDDALSDFWRPRLGRHVVLRALDHDVLSLENGAEPRRMYLLARRQAGRMAVTTYRLGRLSHQALRMCDGTHPLAEICSATGADAERAVRFALHQGCFERPSG